MTETKSRILFVGCGRGEEIAAFEDDESEIVGLEPSRECIEDAKKKLSRRHNVSFLQDSLYGDMGGGYDVIYSVFPAPPMLILKEDAFAERIRGLLNEGGCFTLYSEIWSDNGNTAMLVSCERLKHCFSASGMMTAERILDYEELPKFVRGSGFLRRAEKDTPLRFRELIAQLPNESDGKQ